MLDSVRKLEFLKIVNFSHLVIALYYEKTKPKPSDDFRRAFLEKYSPYLEMAYCTMEE